MGNTVNWQEDVERSREMAKSQGKLVMIDFTAAPR